MPFSLKPNLARASRHAPATLAFLLLAFQALLPWTRVGYVTQDGPSHLYTALVVKDLLLHNDSPYAAVYQFQPALVTNWSTTILMNVTAVLFGTRDAEHAVATLCVVLAFFGFAYLRRALDPQTSAWSPITNFLIFNWFFWIGFFNFYLGMAMLPFALGYAIRHAREMNWQRSLMLAGALVILFFTHVLALALALMSIGLVALWLSLVRTPRSFAWIAASFAPALILLLAFIRASGQSADYDPALAWAWQNFPLHAFASSRGRSGEQALLMPAMLLLMCVGALALRRKELDSAKPALFVAAALCFALYLFAPNTGFGGDEIKIRFAWAVFVFGLTAASTVIRLRPLHLPIAIYIALFLSASLIHTRSVNVQSVSPAVSAYLAALENIPPGSTFVRLRFGTQNTGKRFGFDQAALDPLFHVDSLAAARRRLVALSDYQALSGLFPVGLRAIVKPTQIAQLWELEGGGNAGAASLRALLKDPPVPIDYVIVLGDQPPTELAEDYQSLTRELDAEMRLVTGGSRGSFVRLYQRQSTR